MGLGKKYKIADFYALRNHAAEQGKEFESYLKELTAHVDVLAETTTFRSWSTSSIQKSSTNQTTPFKVWWCIDFLIIFL